MTIKGILTATLLLVCATARSHHAFTPVYDAERTVTVSGVVREFSFVNPHSHMTVSVTDEQGESVDWMVEFDGVLNLTVAGWTKDTIPAGSRVTVTGNATHTNSPRMFFQHLVFADGRELIRPYDDRVGTIDEDRRRRRAEQQKSDPPQ